MKIPKLITLAVLLIGAFAAAFINPKSPPKPQGDKFSGTYTKIFNAGTIHNMHDTTIIGKWFLATTNAPCINLVTCHRVKFINCLFGQASYLGVNNAGIFLDHCDNITVRNCYFENVATGVHVIIDQTIKVDSNQAKNIRGPKGLGGDFAQMNRLSGPGNSVSYNRVENFNFTGLQEDMINLYACNGTPGNAIRVVGNKLRGGGPSITGSGITVGDGPDDNGTTKSSYQLIAYNQVVNSGYAGIQCAGGNHIQIIQNYITSVATPYSHIGLNFLNFHGYPATDITISGNYVNWLAGLASDQFGGSSFQRRDTSIHRPLPGGTPVPTGWTTNIVGTTAVNRHCDQTLLPTQLLTTAHPIH